VIDDVGTEILENLVAAEFALSSYSLDVFLAGCRRIIVGTEVESHRISQLADQYRMGSER
jgi:hypothetical protein